MSAALESVFPNMVRSSYEVTSPATDSYNCIAWAAGVTHQWRWPDPLGDEYWPVDAPRIATLEAFVLAFQSVGYTLSTEAELESSFEKVAIFVGLDAVPAHAARQLGSGTWTSKLGVQVDIMHGTLECMEGDLYVSVVQIKKRPWRVT